MTILFNFASRSRPDRFFAVLNNIREMTTGKDYSVVAKLDEDDEPMMKRRKEIDGYPEVIQRWGYSKSKIHAINRDLDRLPDYQILVNISDDQLFIERGFDRIVKSHMTEDLDLFLHFKDSYAGDRVATMSIMGRTYFERFGYIYNPSYYSLWCDNEAGEVAKLLGKYKLCDEFIFDHWHYSHHNPDKRIFKDALYKRNDTYRQDERIFNERKKINFGLPVNEIVL